MAYQEIALSHLSEAPSVIGAFAAQNGFTVDDTDPDKPKITRPGADAITFEFAYIEDVATNPSSGFYRRLTITDVTSPEPLPPAIIDAPGFQTGGSAVIEAPAPTKLVMFGGQTPQPWLAGAIEFGFNLYRHFYCGMLDKLGAFGGGEVFTGSALYRTTSRNPPGPHDLNMAWPFRGYCDRWNLTTAGNGGARIVHANNPVTWRRFGVKTTTTSSSYKTLDERFRSDEDGNSVILGGQGDGVNVGAALQGKAEYAGEVQLQPINLYTGRRDESAVMHFRAVGAPVGIRMVTMRDIDPGAVLTYGNDQWMVFPVFAKSSSQGWAVSWSGDYDWYFPPPGGESSFYVGHAYLMNG